MWRTKTMKHDEIVGWGCSGVSAILTVTQANDLFQLIQIILTCVAVLVSLSYTIWKWYKNAKKDGKIEQHEVDELFDDINKVIQYKEDDENDRDQG